MRNIRIAVLMVSIVALMGGVGVLSYPTAHEYWHPVRTASLAAEPIEEMAKIESQHLAKLVIDISDYNTRYIDGSVKRIIHLKLYMLLLMIILAIAVTLLGINALGNKHNKS